MGGRAVSAPGGIVTPVRSPGFRATSSSLLSAGPRGGPPPAGEGAGTAGGAESEPVVAAAGQARRGIPALGRGLWLVHRRLCHCRPPGGQGVAGRVVRGGRAMTCEAVPDRAL